MSEDLAAEALTELLNAMESGIESARALLRKVKVEGPNPEGIKWETKQGNKGPYEKAAKQDGKDYQLLVEDLQKHQGKFRRDGFFYWLFEREDAIGRKRL